MRGSDSGQSKKPRGRCASQNAPFVRQPDAREGVSDSDSWCFRCDRLKNLAGGCGCQSLSLDLSQEDLYRQQWSIMTMVYQSTYLAQSYNNQAPMFQFPPPAPAKNQQTANQIGSAMLEPAAGYISEPCYEPVFPSSGAPPPPPPGISTATDPVREPDLPQTSVSTCVSPVSAPALSKTLSESATAQRGESKWDVQTVGDTPKEDMKGKKNHEGGGKNGLEEQVDLDHVNAVDSDLATALVGLQKEERREEKAVARRWRCLETEQPQSDSGTTSCPLLLPNLATVYARLYKEGNKGKSEVEKKKKMRRFHSGGDGADQSAETTPTAPISGSPAAIDPALVRCDYCPLPGLVRREEVNRHLEESHSQVLFSCSFCSSSFPHHLEAQLHVKSNHSGRGSVVSPVDHLLVTHKCLRCRVRLTSREEAEVQEHVNKVHNGWATVRWECRLCGESFPGKEEFEQHLSGRHAAPSPTEQVQKVPFLQFWKGEVEKKKKKLMTEELMRRKTLKFKMISSDSSSSSSEEEEDQKSKLQKYVNMKKRKYLESQVKCEFKAHPQNLGSGMVEESSVGLKQYKTLSWACAFVAASEKEESKEAALVDEIHPKDCFQKRKIKKENRDKSSGECTDTEGSSQDSDDGNVKDELAEEKLLALQSKLEKALKQRKVLTKADQRRMKEVEECDTFFTEGFWLGDEAATEVTSEMGDWEDMEMQESNVKESVIERNNNIVEEKSIGLGHGALEEILVLEQEEGRGENKKRGKAKKKRKMSKISPLRALFPNRFKMGWKRVHS